MAYASKSLTETQQSYAQIEKEALAIAFGCHKFYQYLYGKHFIIESDHKPLETIFKKPLEKCPLRLQRIKINLQNFDFEVKYTPGAQLYFADALSRTGIDNKNFELLIDEIETHTDLLLDNDVISKQQMRNVQEKTDTDPELIVIKELIKHGWPKEKKSLNPIAKPYWKYKSELGIMKDLVFLNERIVIPKLLRHEMIERLHYGHMGVNKTVNKAREVLFWPGYINEIKTKIQSCATCQKFQNSNPNEPLINRKLPPSRPWEAIAVDFFHFNEKEYLLIVNLYSEFPEIVTTIPQVRQLSKH